MTQGSSHLCSGARRPQGRAEAQGLPGALRTAVPLVLGGSGLSYCWAEIPARLGSLCSLLLLALASLGNGNLAGRLWLAGNTVFVAVRLS